MNLHFFAFWFLLLVIQTAHCTESEVCFHPCFNQRDVNHRCKSQRIGQKCYYRFTRETSWQENREWCEDQGLEMVRLARETVPDIAQLHFHGLVGSPTPWTFSYMWLAGKAEHFTEWTFVNRVPVSSTNMQLGFSDSSTLWKDCGFLGFSRTPEYILKVGGCHLRKSYLCRNGDNITAHMEDKTWFSARKKCLRSGGDLFYLNGSEGQEYKERIVASVRKAGVPRGKPLHIGVTHRSWNWLNGDPIVENDWQPDDYGQSCLDVNRLGAWHDFYCHQEFMAFCQRVIPVEEPTTEKPSRVHGDTALELEEKPTDRQISIQGVAILEEATTEKPNRVHGDAVLEKTTNEKKVHRKLMPTLYDKKTKEPASPFITLEETSTEKQNRIHGNAIFEETTAENKILGKRNPTVYDGEAKETASPSLTITIVIVAGSIAGVLILGCVAVIMTLILSRRPQSKQDIPQPNIASPQDSFHLQSTSGASGYTGLSQRQQWQDEPKAENMDPHIYDEIDSYARLQQTAQETGYAHLEKTTPNTGNAELEATPSDSAYAPLERTAPETRYAPLDRTAPETGYAHLEKTASNAGDAQFETPTPNSAYAPLERPACI